MITLNSPDLFLQKVLSFFNKKDLFNVSLNFGDNMLLYCSMDLIIYKLKELVIEFKTDKNMKLILSGLYEKKIKLLDN